MAFQRGVQVLPLDYSRCYTVGDRFQFCLGGMRFAIPHPDQPGRTIIFGPEDVTVLFHPEFQPDAALTPPATQS